MRIAAISDIHGDLRSLQVVWRDIEERGLTGQPVLNAGDTVAYGQQTMDCVDFVREPSRNIVSVSGNYDANTSRFPEKAHAYQQKWGKLRPAKLQALKKASADLTEDARRWLAKLPQVVRLNFEDVVISVSHYAPTEGKEGLFDSTPEARLWQIAAELRDSVDVVVTGHTHTSFVRRAGDILFVNPGSVGRSYGSPTYAEIIIEPGASPEARIISCRVLQR